MNHSFLCSYVIYRHRQLAKAKFVITRCLIHSETRPTSLFCETIIAALFFRCRQKFSINRWSSHQEKKSSLEMNLRRRQCYSTLKLILMKLNSKGKLCFRNRTGASLCKSSSRLIFSGLSTLQNDENTRQERLSETFGNSTFRVRFLLDFHPGTQNCDTFCA